MKFSGGFKTALFYVGCAAIAVAAQAGAAWIGKSRLAAEQAALGKDLCGGKVAAGSARWAKRPESACLESAAAELARSMAKAEGKPLERVEFSALDEQSGVIGVSGVLPGESRQTFTFRSFAAAEGGWAVAPEGSGDYLASKALRGEP